MAFLRYTLYRILFVLGAAGLLYLAGMRSFLMWAVAIVIGALLSYVLLDRPRRQAVAEIAAHDPLKKKRREPKPDAASAEEDSLIDSTLADDEDRDRSEEPR